MALVIIPHRSVLFMPASNERAVNKATSLPADTIVFDLEDALHESEQQRSSELLDAALKRDFKYRQVLVRINALDTDLWKSDIRAVMGAIDKGGSCHGLVVPKVESTDSLQQLFEYLPDENPLPVWIMIETPIAVLKAASLCSFGASVCGVLIGTADLGKGLSISSNIATIDSAGSVHDGAATAPIPRLGLLTALSQVVLAARAHGLLVIDGVFMDFRDDAGLQQEAMQGLQLGFDGKTLIHPSQIETTNRVFTPDATEIDEARAMIAAWQQANQAGEAVCSFKGRLVEELHVRQAQARITYYDSITSR